MAPYTPIYKDGQITLGTGSAVVVTGWTVAATVTKHLKPSDYAAVGQLYSPARGVDVLIRNLLANPQIWDVALISATKEDQNAQACERVRDFFEHGFEWGEHDGTEGWIVPGDNPAFIDAEIPEDALNRLRKFIRCHWYESLKEALQGIPLISHRPKPEPWADAPLIFPKREHVPTVFPGPRYGHRIEGKTIAETWVRIIHRIKTTGTIRPTGYSGFWQELIDLTAVVTDEPEDFYFPEPNYLPCDRPFILEYIPQILNDAPHREGVKYTYGQRLRSWFGRDQIKQVIAKLNGEIDAASAVMNLWDVEDHEKGGSPCLNHIWVRVVDGELSLTATFRSNDMFSAWPANAMGLRALQRHILERVTGAERMGPLITISQSAHIYDDCWDNADSLIKNHHFSGGNKKPAYDDPAGDFLISVEGETVRVTQTFPAGTECQSWEGRNPTKLMRQVALAVPHIQTAHALYLGGEIQRACACLRDGVGFIQDGR